MGKIIEIDGSHGSGGGQILRTAISLSAITGNPCRIFSIRAGRKKPGLMPQHLLGIQNVAKLCNGYIEGDEIRSEEIKFYPGEIKARDLHIRIGTAGSITLCCQSILPVALFASSPIKIFFHGGGTDVPFSPTFDYFRFVFLKILEKMNVKADIKILKRGYYPTGGAEVEIKIYPLLHQGSEGQASKLKKINLTERGALKKILILSSASVLLKEKKVAERQIRGTQEILGKLRLPIQRKMEYFKTDSPGSAISILCEFENTIIGSDGLGRLGKPAEQVGRECALQLLEEERTKACLDKHLADQILIFMALAKGKSQVNVSEITNHCKTNIWVIEKFLNGKFKIEGNLITWIPNILNNVK